LAEAVEVLTAERGLVLWLEDLQWSDVSTLDWLAFVARRRESCHLLVIGTYRPVDVIVGNHPLKAVKQELHLHGQCEELPLRFLRKEEVEAYLAKRFAAPSPVSTGEACPEQSRRGRGEGLAPAPLRKLAHLIHRRTDGNPLFMVNVIDYLVMQGVLVQSEGHWTVAGEVAMTEAGVPESLQQMIEQQIERLSPADQRILEVASVAGVEFSAAAVAAGVGAAVEEVEERCVALARRGQFVQASGTAEWPDGTVATRYSFLHALYQEVLYDRLTAGRRQRLHRQIGEREEQAYGERAREIATELAVHFERGRDYRKAIHYLHQAGENAVRRSANQEAINLLTKGLELLKTLPDTPECAQQELGLQITLGPALIATKGWAAPEVERAYTRAQELCQQLGETPQLFTVLAVLRAFYSRRAETQTALQLGEYLLQMAQNVQDPDLLLEAHYALGVPLFTRGEFVLARVHFEQSFAFYESQQHRSHAFLYGQDPGVICLYYAAWTLWLLGYPDQALKKSHNLLTLAQELSHPLSMALACFGAARVHQFRREEQTVREQTEAVVRLSTEQGLSYSLAVGTLLHGWVLVGQGQEEEGIEQMHQGQTAWEATRTEGGRPYNLALLAEAYGKMGHAEEGLSVLAEALEAMDKTGERWYEAELYRLYGELSLRIGEAGTAEKEPENRRRGESENRSRESVSSSPVPRFSGSPVLSSSARFPVSSPEDSFLKAIEIARRQSAKSWELRATVSLVRLWQSQGKKKQAHKILAEIYGWFTEGFDTKDLQEAKALLEELTH
jgi:predicted ATPase